MRVMVTGSRDWRDMAVIRKALEDLEMYNPSDQEWELVNGCASGADAIARSVAVHLGWLPLDFWPDYVAFDFAEANKVRNVAMVDSRPDVILAFPTRGSRGTWHAVRTAKERGYVLDDTLWIYSEQKEVRRTKDIAEFPRSST
jgi:hypothetical protein